MSGKYVRGNYIEVTFENKTGTPGGTARVLNVSPYHGDGSVYQVRYLDTGQIALVDERLMTLSASQSDQTHGQQKL